MEILRLSGDAALYFLTFSVVEWLPIFVGEDPCRIFTDSLNFCHDQKGLRVNAFVIMPTHVHLIVLDSDMNVERLQQSLTDMRKFTGRRLADHFEQNLPAAWRQVMHDTPRTDRERQIWQQSRHPEAIQSQAFWRSKIDYLHDNPRRKGLVRDATHWRFSSAAYWLLDPPGETDVILTAVEW
jgi:putative transposase